MDRRKIQRLQRLLRTSHGDPVALRKQLDSPDVILVLVGKQDSVYRIRGNCNRCKAFLNLAAGQAGVNENIDRAIGDKGDIAATSATEDRDQESYVGPPSSSILLESL